MKEWGATRGKMESEIARKKEHLNVATNFEKARGWVRQSFKTKNYRPGCETHEEFLQLSSSDEEGILSQEEDEDFDQSSKKMSPSKNLKQTIFTDMTEDPEYGIRPPTNILCQ